MLLRCVLTCWRKSISSKNTTPMKVYYDRALELFESDYGTKADIARKLKEEFSTEESAEAIRKNISKYINKQDHKALEDACDEFGIPLDRVNHYWYKGKNISIHAKSDDKKTLEEFKDDILASMMEYVPSYEKVSYTPNKEAYLLIVDPADVHVGKLASSFETGEEYNNQIAIKRVKEGVAGILHKARGFNIDQILLVAGNDILHIDTPRRTTTSGTPQDTDGMWYDNFMLAKQLYVEVIEMLMQVAPVHFMYNPSNHDYTNGFFLADVIKTWFNKCENITFDCTLAHRKYYKYGNSLIGTTHGDGAKQQDLPLLMAQEASDNWSTSKHRYVYTHHVHHKVAKDYIGVTVESLRSPSSADGWHHRNGYQHNPKAIEGFIHCKNNGQIARLTHIF